MSRSRTGGLVMACIAFGACTGAGARDAAAPEAQPTDTAGASLPPSSSLAVEVPRAPTPVVIRGAVTLVYELRISNLSDVAYRLGAVTVANADGPGRLLAALEGPDLARATASAGPASDTAGVLVPAGSEALVYMWLTLDAGAPVPDSLRHRVVFGPAAPTPGGDLVSQPPAVPVRGGTPEAFGPPLEGSSWVAVYDPGLERGHRRVRIPGGGEERIPARFAIDWMRVDERGRLFGGDGSRVADWHGYGADVLAVADARVVGVRSSMAEPTVLGPTDHDPEEGAGNYVSLDLGDGRYVHYEHLEPGSVQVEVGERVRRGDVVARVGYTGNSGGPHLHMHVSDGRAPLDGEGLPWTLADFRISGMYPSLEELGRGRPQPHEDGRRTAELPPPLAVIDFGRAAGAPG